MGNGENVMKNQALCFQQVKDSLKIREFAAVGLFVQKNGIFRG